jgi:4-hydroxy-tetrahydrodipicolinate synthase
MRTERSRPAGRPGSGCLSMIGSCRRRAACAVTGRAESSVADIFTGVGVALVTLLDEDGRVDPTSTAGLACHLVAGGMRGVLVSGTTGEAATLTGDERTALIRAVRAALPADVPVLAGTGATATGAAAELTAAAAGAGADAILAWPPPDCQDLAAYYAALAAAAGGLPVLAYHIPRVSAPGVPVSVLADLPIAGLKDSSGDPDRLLAEVVQYPGSTYVGSSALLALAGPLGAAGAILAVANLEPELCVRAFAGDAAAQRDLTGVHQAVRAGGPPAIKQLLAARRGTVALSRQG